MGVLKTVGCQSLKQVSILHDSSTSARGNSHSGPAGAYEQ
ncbi:hypothetical protein HMPREF1618_00752 [Escherichia coli 908691]|nr:hypothetical protein HMPREF1618_00752 [Escherichia coli 908691]